MYTHFCEMKRIKQIFFNLCSYFLFVQYSKTYSLVYNPVRILIKDWESGKCTVLAFILSLTLVTPGVV